MALPKYFSKEWLDEVVKKVNSDEEYLKKTTKFNAKTWIIIMDCPDGNDVSVKFTYEQGKVTNYLYETEPAPSKFRIGNSPWDESISLFRTQASYETWTKIQKRELAVMAAQKAGVYESEGDIVKRLKLLPFITAYSQVQATVPCEF